MSNEKKEEKQKEDCPLCKISDETIAALKKTSKRNDGVAGRTAEKQIIGKNQEK